MQVVSQKQDRMERFDTNHSRRGSWDLEEGSLQSVTSWTVSLPPEAKVRQNRNESSRHSKQRIEGQDLGK